MASVVAGVQFSEKSLNGIKLLQSPHYDGVCNYVAVVLSFQCMLCDYCDEMAELVLQHVTAKHIDMQQKRVILPVKDKNGPVVEKLSELQKQREPSIYEEEQDTLFDFDQVKPAMLDLRSEFDFQSELHTATHISQPITFTVSGDEEETPTLIDGNFNKDSKMSPYCSQQTDQPDSIATYNTMTVPSKLISVDNDIPISEVTNEIVNIYNKTQQQQQQHQESSQCISFDSKDINDESSSAEQRNMVKIAEKFGHILGDINDNCRQQQGSMETFVSDVAASGSLVSSTALISTMSDPNSVPFNTNTACEMVQTPIAIGSGGAHNILETTISGTPFSVTPGSMASFTLAPNAIQFPAANSSSTTITDSHILGTTISGAYDVEHLPISMRCLQGTSIPLNITETPMMIDGNINNPLTSGTSISEVPVSEDQVIRNCISATNASLEPQNCMANSGTSNLSVGNVSEVATSKSLYPLQPVSAGVLTQCSENTAICSLTEGYVSGSTVQDNCYMATALTEPTSFGTQIVITPIGYTQSNPLHETSVSESDNSPCHSSKTDLVASNIHTHDLADKTKSFVNTWGLSLPSHNGQLLSTINEQNFPITGGSFYSMNQGTQPVITTSQGQLVQYSGNVAPVTERTNFNFKDNLEHSNKPDNAAKREIINECKNAKVLDIHIQKFNSQINSKGRNEHININNSGFNWSNTNKTDSDHNKTDGCHSKQENATNSSLESRGKKPAKKRKSDQETVSIKEEMVKKKNNKPQKCRNSEKSEDFPSEQELNRSCDDTTVLANEHSKSLSTTLDINSEVCTYCGKKFKSIKDCLNHCNKVHKDKPLPSQVTSYLHKDKTLPSQVKKENKCVSGAKNKISNNIKKTLIIDGSKQISTTEKPRNNIPNTNAEVLKCEKEKMEEELNKLSQCLNDLAEIGIINDVEKSQLRNEEKTTKKTTSKKTTLKKKVHTQLEKVKDKVIVLKQSTDYFKGRSKYKREKAGKKTSLESNDTADDDGDDNEDDDDEGDETENDINDVVTTDKQKEEDERPLKCAYCGERFETARDGFKHYGDMHKDGLEFRVNKTNQCILSDKVKIRREKYIRSRIKTTVIDDFDMDYDIKLDLMKYYKRYKLDNTDDDDDDDDVEDEGEKKSVNNCNSLDDVGNNSMDDSSKDDRDYKEETSKGNNKNIARAHKRQLKLKISKSSTCPMCYLKFKPRNIEKHMAVVHYWGRITRSKRDCGDFICHICGKKFKYKKNLLSHEKVAHEGKKRYDAYDDLRELKCSTCDYTTKEKRRLENHVQVVHMGLMPYKCQYCDYVCGERTALRDHMYRHFKLKPITCKYCNYGSIQKGSMKAHLKKQHQIVLDTAKAYRKLGQSAEEGKNKRMSILEDHNKHMTFNKMENMVDINEVIKSQSFSSVHKPVVTRKKTNKSAVNNEDPANTSNNIAANTSNNIVANTSNNIAANTSNNIAANTSNNIVANTSNNIAANIGNNIVINTGNNIVINTGNNIATNIGNNIAINTGNNIATNIGNNIATNTGNNISTNTGNDIATNTGNDITTILNSQNQNDMANDFQGAGYLSENNVHILPMENSTETNVHILPMENSTENGVAVLTLKDNAIDLNKQVKATNVSTDETPYIQYGNSSQGLYVQEQKVQKYPTLAAQLSMMSPIVQPIQSVLAANEKLAAIQQKPMMSSNQEFVTVGSQIVQPESEKIDFIPVSNTTNLPHWGPVLLETPGYQVYTTQDMQIIGADSSNVQSFNTVNCVDYLTFNVPHNNNTN